MAIKGRQFLKGRGFFGSFWALFNCEKGPEESSKKEKKALCLNGHLEKCERRKACWLDFITKKRRGNYGFLVFLGMAESLRKVGWPLLCGRGRSVTKVERNGKA